MDHGEPVLEPGDPAGVRCKRTDGADVGGSSGTELDVVADVNGETAGPGLHDDEMVSEVHRLGGQAEPTVQVDDRHDLPADVDDALDHRRGPRQRAHPNGSVHLDDISGPQRTAPPADVDDDEELVELRARNVTSRGGRICFCGVLTRLRSEPSTQSAT